MEKLLKFLGSALSSQEKTKLITDLFAKHVPAADQKAMITSVLTALPNLDTAGIAAEVFKGSNQGVQRAILTDILQIAVAGGEGFLTGGTTGAEMSAGMEAATVLLGALQKTSAA